MSADIAQPDQPDQSRVPPVLRNLHQCKACGFPVSAGRALCVECEEKKWRGQLKVPPPAASRQSSVTPRASAPTAPAFAAGASSAAPAARLATPGQASPALIGARSLPPLASGRAQQNDSPQVRPEVVSGPAPETPLDPLPDFVLSAGLEPAQSWFSRNRYMLGAILVIAAVVAAIFLLR